MHTIVRATLEKYLKEGKVIDISDLGEEHRSHLKTKEAVFVTLYHEGKVVASSGRIMPTKENTLLECIDNALICLSDPRISAAIPTPDQLASIHIRTDRLAPRRLLKSIDELDTRTEGLILLSQNLGLLSVVLPGMVHLDTSPRAYFALACAKAGVEMSKLSPSDYVIYGFSTTSEVDFG